MTIQPNHARALKIIAIVIVAILCAPVTIAFLIASMNAAKGSR